MKNNQIPSRVDFDNYQNLFIERMKAVARKYEHGIVKKGLDISLDFKENKIKCTSGVGFSSSGVDFSLKRNLSISFPNIAKNKPPYCLIYLKTEDKNLGYINIQDIYPSKQKPVYSGYKWVNQEITLHAKHIEEESLTIADPEDRNSKYIYSHPFFKEENVLVIGAMVLGVQIPYSGVINALVPINRESQLTKLKIGEVGLYYGSDFIPFVTVKGCVVAKDLLGKFIKFSETPGETGGSNNTTLNSSHIPSLGRIEGYAKEAGKHSHKHDSYEYLNDDDGDGHGGYWDEVTWIATSKAPYHGHNIQNANYVNNNPESINIEPPYRTLIPIRRIV